MAGAALRTRRLIVAAAVGLITAVGAFSPAMAHTFLTRSSPEAGARLTSAPTEILLDFTEPVDTDAVVQLWTSTGERVEVASVGRDNDLSVVRAGLPALDENGEVVHHLEAATFPNWTER